MRSRPLVRFGLLFAPRSTRQSLVGLAALTAWLIAPVFLPEGGTLAWSADGPDIPAVTADQGGAAQQPNDPPVVQEVEVDEDGSVLITLSSDPDEELVYEIERPAAHGVLTVTPPPGVSPDSTRFVTYTPNPDFAGADSFVFAARAGFIGFAPATVSITVKAINDAPVIAFVSGHATYPENAGAVVLAPAAAVTDVDSPDFGGGAMTVTIVANGQTEDRLWVRNEGSGPDQIAVTPNGAIAFGGVLIGTASGGSGTVPLTISLTSSATPTAVQALARNITYRNVSEHPSTAGRTITGVVTDGDGATSNVVSGTLSVERANDAPVAMPISASVSEDDKVAVTLAASDADGDTLTYAIVTPPQHGVLSGVGPQVVYTPHADYAGSDSFSYTASDGTATSAPAVVTLSVRAVNDAPTAFAAKYPVDEDGKIAITLDGTDPDGDVLTYVVVSSPANGTLVSTPPAGTMGGGQYLTYTPKPDYHGTDSFTFKVSDGTVESTAATVWISVQARNDAPIATPQQSTLSEDGSIAITLAGVDPDGDLLSYTVASAPARGALTGTAPRLVYTPAADFAGTDGFTFTVSDGTATSTAAAVTLVVQAVNDGPTAQSSQRSVDEDATVTFALQGTDIDGDPLTFTIVTPPSHGVLGGSVPDVTFTPNPDFNGSDSFTFEVSDGTVTSDAATVWIQVRSVNDAPVIDSTAPGAATVGQGYSYVPIASDVDSAVTLSAPTLPAWLTFAPGSDGTWTLSGTPGSADVGQHAVVLQASDGSLAATQSFSLTVGAAPGILISSASGLTVTEGGGVATFGVVLSAAPTQPVAVVLSSSDISAGTVSPSSLTFDPTTWHVTQTVTLSAVDDAVADGPQGWSVVIAPSTSADPAFAGLDANDLAVTTLDDDVAGVLASAAPTLLVSESGTSATVSIALRSQPTGDVVIPLASSDATEGSVAPASLTFTPATWNTPRVVTITGRDDAIADGNQVWALLLGRATSADLQYDGLDAADLAITTTDDDSSGITVTPIAGLTTSETGATATFVVVLNSEPTADVTVDLVVDRLDEGRVSPGQLTFTPQDWSAPRTVTLTGQDDDLLDGARTFVVTTAPATSQDPSYSGIDAPDVTVVNHDDDVAGVMVMPGSRLVTTEAGGAATVALVLTSRPTHDVMVAVQSSDVTAATVAPASVTFTPSTWNAPREITVTGVDDSVVDGDQSYSVVVAPAASADAAYDGLDPIDVGGITLDDDVAPSAPPAISAPADVTIEGPSAVAFVVTDPDTPLDALRFMVQSSDPDVLPADGLAVRGSGGLRTLRLTPARTGRAEVTIVVSDGERSATTRFGVTVVPVQLTGTTIDQVVPAAGPVRGGTQVTLTGRGFHPRMVPFFDDQPSVAFHVINETTIVATAPAQASAGAVPVSLREVVDEVAVVHALRSSAFVYGDEVPVQVTIATPARRAEHVATTPTIDLAGAAVSGDGLAQVRWRTDRGASGVATGLESWRATGVPVESGRTRITVEATDSTGATAVDEIDVTIGSLYYYLAEGATGIFDLDVVVANPSAEPAPIRVTFMREDGSTITQVHEVGGQAQLTVRVNEVPGLERAPVSTVVESTRGLPLVVERTMAWDGPKRAAHAGTAVAGPRVRWYFGEGSQGFFDTYVLLANPQASWTTARLRFLTEGGDVVTRTVLLAPTSRQNVFVGDIPALVATSFSIVIDADQPIIAERAMYFGRVRAWDGGHASAGVPEPATDWFHAEGATGPFFDTYILVGNPNFVPAHVEFVHVTDQGERIVRQVTIPAETRLTVDLEQVDPRLAHANVSTRIVSDVPVISERSMYWPGGFADWQEGHNSFGATAAGLRWGVADGQVGGAQDAQTYLLLSNTTADTAQVTLTFLRAGGTPVTRRVDVAPFTRMTVNAHDVPELVGTRFGAVVESTNGVPVIVERSMYWGEGARPIKAGTNVLATPLP